MHRSNLICRTVLFFLFLFFDGYGHAFLIKGSGRDVTAKGKDSESDLLQEIDKALKIGRGFLLEQGAFTILLNY